MKKLDHFLAGFIPGIFLPLLVYVIYFTIRDPKLALVDQVIRMKEAGTLTYYLSLSALANLGIFFLFLNSNAEKAARGVVAATIVYVFAVLISQLL